MKKIKKYVCRTRNRTRKGIGSLPMKMRALPKSFWQQPNKTATLPPGSEFLVSVQEDEIITECNNNENEENKTEIITDANIDLLFSLFKDLDNEIGNKKVHKNDRERSLFKKGWAKNKSNLFKKKIIRDEDPYLISNVSEKFLPLISAKSKNDNNSIQRKIENGQKILAMITGNNDSLMFTTNNNDYSKILNDLIIEL